MVRIAADGSVTEVSKTIDVYEGSKVAKDRNGDQTEWKITQFKPHAERWSFAADIHPLQG
jgi:hypothetical protein